MDELAYACAAAVVSVSRNIVHIGIEIRRQGVLAGPYWFMLYAEYISILSLVFYAVENPEKPGSGDVLIDAKAGRDMIEELKSKSHAAERVAGALDASDVPAPFTLCICTNRCRFFSINCHNGFCRPRPSKYQQESDRRLRPRLAPFRVTVTRNFNPL